MDNRIIGPYAFDGTLTSDVYIDFLRNELPRHLLDAGVSEQERSAMIYQHDGAPAHTANATVEVMQELFPYRYIGKGGVVVWPARSPDLNPCDYTLWSVVKSRLYKGGGRFNGSQNACRRELFEIILDLEAEIVENATRAIIKRVMCCAQQQGSYFENFLQ